MFSARIFGSIAARSPTMTQVVAPEPTTARAAAWALSTVVALMPAA